MLLSVSASHITFNCSRAALQYLNQPAMSGKFNSTGTTFPHSNVFRQEELIREIVQNEVIHIFDDIKIEIESKIRSIDRNIADLRTQIRKITQPAKSHHDLADVLARVDKIEAEINVLRYHQQLDFKNSRTQSLDKERKPIFRRNSNEHDFSSVILGLETQPKLQQQLKSLPKQEMLKPPLPKQLNRPKQQPNRSKSQAGLGVGKQGGNGSGSGSGSVSGKGKMVMQDSGTIHRWLHQNNNRQSSCFSSIIREEDIEESVFY